MRFGIPAAILGSLYRKDTGLGLPWRVTTMYSTVTSFPWCNVQRRNTYLAFCVPCLACDEPCRPADRDTWRLRLQPPPKRGTRHGRYLCLDPFLTVCTNGSPALSSREASQYSSAFQGKSPYFRKMSPRPKHSELFSYLDHLNLRLGPNPTVTLRRLRPCFCSHRLTPLRLSPADTPPLLFFSLTLLDGLFLNSHTF